MSVAALTVLTISYESTAGAWIWALQDEALERAALGTECLGV